MDRRLASFLLLTLLALAVTSADPKAPSEQELAATEKTTRANEPSLKYKYTALTVTVWIPTQLNKNTGTLTSSLATSENSTMFLISTQRYGKETPCTNPSCTEEPELAVSVYQGEELISSSNVTDENFFLTIASNSSKITVSHYTTAGVPNKASVTVHVIGRMNSLAYVISTLTMIKFQIEVEQILIPTTPSVATTATRVSTTAKKTVTTATSIATTTAKKLRTSATSIATTKAKKLETTATSIATTKAKKLETTATSIATTTAKKRVTSATRIASTRGKKLGTPASSVAPATTKKNMTTTTPFVASTTTKTTTTTTTNKAATMTCEALWGIFLLAVIQTLLS